MTEQYLNELPNHCPLVNDKVPYQTCLKCCFKGKTAYGAKLDTDVRIGARPKDIYESVSVGCNFKVVKEK